LRKFEYVLEVLKVRLISVVSLVGLIQIRNEFASTSSDILGHGQWVGYAYNVLSIQVGLAG